MFGLVALDMLESLRLAASEGFDSNCDGGIRQFGLRVMKEKRGTSEWKSFYRLNPCNACQARGPWLRHQYAGLRHRPSSCFVAIMSSGCKECGHPTQFSRDIGSAVCTHCGTLVDSSQQSALTSASDFLPDTYTHDLHALTRPTTLKSIRRNAAWDLPGQASNSRNERNKVLCSFPFSFPY